MIEVLVWLTIFILDLIVLIKASDYFTDSAEKIGLWFGLPAFIVGVTIVAIGTSLPELISSIFAVLENSSEIVIGNVIGSNVTNILLILGIAAIIGKKISVSYDLVGVDLPLLVGSTFLFTIAIYDGVFTIYEAITFLLLLLVYFSYTLNTEKEEEKGKKKKKREPFEWKNLLVLLIGVFFIFLSAKYTVASVIKLAEIFNIGKEIIALTAVALGTSLPELMVTISAAKKGKAEMAVGNILGSNIFNTLAVMGIPAFFGTLIIPKNMITFGLPVMLLTTILYFFITQDRQITKWEGWMLIIFYLFFIGKTFGIV